MRSERLLRAWRPLRVGCPPRPSSFPRTLNPTPPARSPTDGETRMFYEIVIAPGYTPEGLEVLKEGLVTIPEPNSEP